MSAQTMRDESHNILILLFAVVLGVAAVVWMVGGVWNASGAFPVLGYLFLGLFNLATGVGFARRRGWAFLVVSVGLLLSWMSCFIMMIIAFDAGLPGVGVSFLFGILGTMALIAYFGRFSMERRFRPHLDIH